MQCQMGERMAFSREQTYTLNTVHGNCYFTWQEKKLFQMIVFFSGLLTKKKFPVVRKPTPLNESKGTLLLVNGSTKTE